MSVYVQCRGCRSRLPFTFVVYDDWKRDETGWLCKSCARRPAQLRLEEIQ